MSSLNSFGTRSHLSVDGRNIQYFSLAALEDAGNSQLARLPVLF